MSSRQPAEPPDQRWRTSSEEFVAVAGRSMQKAVDAAVAEHHRAGRPVAIWQDGQVGWLYPDGRFEPVEAEGGGEGPG